MMKCAIYDHPLVDGVLVEHPGVVNFIRKRFADFRTLEKICRTCKEPIVRIYRDKMKRAIALHKSRLRDSSIPTLASSSTSSSQHSSTSLDSYDRLIDQTPKHVKIKRNPATNAISTSLAVTPSENIQPLTADSIRNGSAKTNSNNSHSMTRRNLSGIDEISADENAIVPGSFLNNPRLSQEPTTSKAATTSGVSTLSSNVTVRKRTIPDYLKSITSDIRRDSEQPTTSKAAANATGRKRPISDVINDSSDDDEPRHSLNSLNGTPLPNIQPMPPKRKPRTDLTPSQLAMVEYARNITGG